MKAIAQRVLRCSVQTTEGKAHSMEEGVLVFVGVEREDTTKHAHDLVGQIMRAKIFPSNKREFAFSLPEIGKDAMIIPQITLCGTCAPNGRVSFDRAADPALAQELYLSVVQECERYGVRAVPGFFGEHMHVALLNDGPVTFQFTSSL